ncbi:MAG TPA: hypothetical protein VFB21_01740 [Chthonomonadaceae bacterium]|nr:hypothetical protein [Chthonomonadaceae bacterium]
MSDKHGSILTTLAPIVFGLVIGGVGGYYLHSFNAPPVSVAAASTAPAGGGGGRMGPGGGGMGAMMGGRGGGGGGFGGGQATSASALPRLVRNLAMIEKVQHKGLDAEQKKKLRPLLQQLQSADKLSEQECTAKLTAIQAVLTDAQKQTLQDLQPGRPGGGMGGRGGGMGGMMGGGGGGFGGGQDPEHPFASERNKQALTDLIASLGSS